MSDTLPKNLFWRGGVLWARVKIKGSEYRVSLRTRSLALAKKRLKTVRVELEEQAFFGGQPPVTWQQGVVAWFAWVQRQHKRAGTIKRYRVSLNQLRPWLDDLEIQRIDAALIRTIVRDRSRLGVSNATIRRDLTAISSVLDAAIDEGWIEENPAHSYDRRRLKEIRDPITLPDDDSIAAVLALNSRFIDMAALAIETGMRQEEIASLRHDQVDTQRMAISLTHTKGRRAREVPLCPAALAIIRKQPPFFSAPWVFWHGEGERYKTVASHFFATQTRVAKNCARQGRGFTRFRFHDLRHLFAVRYLRNGTGSLYDLQQVLGHTSVKTTEIYLDHLRPEEKQKAVYGVAQKGAHDHGFTDKETG